MRAPAMDILLRQLKRKAQASSSLVDVWHYATALERLQITGESDLKLYQVVGHEGGTRPLFHCIAVDVNSARAQFDMAVKEQKWGKVLWDHVFEDYAGPVDGWQQPINILVDENQTLPIKNVPKRANFLVISEVSLNKIEEFC